MSTPNVPAFRRYTRILPLALGARVRAQDDSTGLTFTHFQRSTVLLDLVNSPDPAVAGQRFQIFLIKGSVDSGREFFSDASSANSAGRSSPGPVAISGGGGADIAFDVAQVAGAPLAAYSFIVKWSNL